MRNIMPTSIPIHAEAATATLRAVGQQIRTHRKRLRVSATSAAQAAGMSRVTLHRIERGEASVTMGAYMNAAAALGLDRWFHRDIDVHVHVPEGAIPKDGPSAGITMATAIVSALTRIPVRREVAMTGEITLRGKVLPIGGLKEKLLAAHRAGLRTVIIPRDNEKDLAETPREILDALHVIPVSSMDEVLPIVFERMPRIEPEILTDLTAPIWQCRSSIRTEGLRGRN